MGVEDQCPVCKKLSLEWLKSELIPDGRNTEYVMEARCMEPNCSFKGTAVYILKFDNWVKGHFLNADKGGV